jgi:hypothetical protein
MSSIFPLAINSPPILACNPSSPTPLQRRHSPLGSSLLSLSRFLLKTAPPLSASSSSRPGVGSTPTSPCPSAAPLPPNASSPMPRSSPNSQSSASGGLRHRLLRIWPLLVPRRWPVVFVSVSVRVPPRACCPRRQPCSLFQVS